jgi:hypothetical protein
VNGLFEAAVEVQEFCTRRNWKFCFIGGLGVVRWGRPRQTNDVDLMLLTGFGNEHAFIDMLLEEYASRIGSPREFALENRILLLAASNGVPIDLSLAGLPFEEAMIHRATDWQCDEGIFLRTASAEDMIVLKSFASRPQDWFDVEQIVVRQGNTLNWKLILSDLQPLSELKEAPEILERLNMIRDRAARE